MNLRDSSERGNSPKAHLTHGAKVNVNCFCTSELFTIQLLPQLPRCGATDKTGNELSFSLYKVN